MKVCPYCPNHPRLTDHGMKIHLAKLHNIHHEDAGDERMTESEIGKPWTRKEITALRQNWGSLQGPRIARCRQLKEMLSIFFKDRSAHAMSGKSANLGLECNVADWSRYSRSEEQTIRDWVVGNPNTDAWKGAHSLKGIIRRPVGGIDAKIRQIRKILNAQPSNATPKKTERTLSIEDLIGNEDGHPLVNTAKDIASVDRNARPLLRLLLLLEDAYEKKIPEAERKKLFVRTFNLVRGIYAQHEDADKKYAEYQKWLKSILPVYDDFVEFIKENGSVMMKKYREFKAKQDQEEALRVQRAQDEIEDSVRRELNIDRELKKAN